MLEGAVADALIQLALLIPDLMRLVDHEHLPIDRLEEAQIGSHGIVRGDHHVGADGLLGQRLDRMLLLACDRIAERIRPAELVGASTIARFATACVRHHGHLRHPALELALPVRRTRQRSENEERTAQPLAEQRAQEGAGLHGLAETHL